MTGYRLPCERLITFATLKFESFQRCVHPWLVIQHKYYKYFIFKFQVLRQFCYTPSCLDSSPKHSYYNTIRWWVFWPNLASLLCQLPGFTILTKIPSNCVPTSLCFLTNLNLYVMCPKSPTARFKYRKITRMINKAGKNKQIIRKLITQIKWTVNKHNKWTPTYKWIHE